MFPRTTAMLLASRRAPAVAARPVPALPPFSTTTLLRARKDTMDKDSINTESNEYSKTGGDSAAAHSDAAFDPATTRPGEQVEEAEGTSSNGKGGNPLDASPGNEKVNKHKSEENTGSSQSAGPSSQSGQRSSGGKSTGQ